MESESVISCEKKKTRKTSFKKLVVEPLNPLKGKESKNLHWFFFS